MNAHQIFSDPYIIATIGIKNLTTIKDHAKVSQSLL